MLFICKICQTEINVRPSRKRQYCSMPCYRLSRKGKHLKPANFICLECGKSSRIRPSRTNKKYCSIKCQSKSPIFRKQRSLMTPKGSSSHLWRGGVSTINEKLRKCSEYEIWRIKIFERDNYTCQICKEIGGYLQADHIKPFSLYPELRLDLNNGQTLCIDCHATKTKNDMKTIRKEQYRGIFV